VLLRHPAQPYRLYLPPSMEPHQVRFEPLTVHWQGTPTRSPAANRFARFPFSTTRPTISCPGINGGFGLGNSPSPTCKSVRQTAQAWTWIKTWPELGFRTEASSGRRG
jgi:hypothetical protein